MRHIESRDDGLFMRKISRQVLNLPGETSEGVYGDLSIDILEF